MRLRTSLLLLFLLLFPAIASPARAPGPKIEPHQNDYPADAWLCCDGKGGFRTCWRPALDRSSPTFRCLFLHERDHILYFRRAYPDACEGQPPGYPWFMMTLEELQRAECQAYRIQMQCLTAAGYLELALVYADMADRAYNCLDIWR